MGLVIQAVAAGLAAGAVYALVGLGFGLIHQMSGVLNFAHGDLVTGGIFAVLLVLGGGAVAGGQLSPLAAVASAVVALAATAAAGAALQRVAVAPFLARGSAIGWVAATVAAGIFIRSLVGLRFQAETYTVPDLLPVRALGHDGVIGLPDGGVLQVRAVATLVLALLLAFIFDRWLGHSRVGRAMRAAAQDADAARLVGVSPERLRLAAFAIAGLLAAAAGLMLAPARPVSLDLGVVLGLKGTAAAVIGGLGSARRTVVAGLAIGVAEGMLTTLPLPVVGALPGLQDTGALLLLVFALVFVPRLVDDTREMVD